MPRKHIVFDGAEVERIWAGATQAWLADEVHRVSAALREEVRFAHNRVDRGPRWPEPPPFVLSSTRLAEVALQVATFSGVPVEGPAPEGFVRIGEFEGSRLLRRAITGLELALEWEVPDQAFPIDPRPG